MATEGIQLLDEELIELEDVITRGIEELKNLQTRKAEEKAIFIQDRIKRAKQSYRNFRVEVQELEGAERRKYVAKGKEHNALLKDLMNEFSFAKDRSDLVGPDRNGDVDPDNMTAGQLMHHGISTQEKDIQILDQIEAQVVETQAIGAGTIESLQEQTVTLTKIDEDLANIEGYLKRADRELRQFVRKIATDKLVLCLIFLIISGIVFIIVWKIVKPKSAPAINIPTI